MKKSDSRILVYRVLDETHMMLEKEYFEKQGAMGCLSRNGLICYITNKEPGNRIYYRKRNSLEEEFGDELYELKTFEAGLRIGQVRPYDDGRRFVMVLSGDQWNNNNIYFWDEDSTLNTSATGTKTPLITELPVTSEEKRVVEELPLNEVVVSTSSLSETGSELFRAELGKPFPNPCINTFFVYYKLISGLNASPHLIITDMQNKAVLRQLLEKKQGEARIDVSHLAAGTYFMKLECKGVSTEMVRLVISGR
jgi:hypothetical protein